MLKNSFKSKMKLTLIALLATLQVGQAMANYTVKAATQGWQGDETSYSAKASGKYNWNNIAPIKRPKLGKSNGKLVLFDNSHGETSGQADWVIDGGFSDFADDLVSHGYTVKEYRGVDKNGDGVIRYYDDRQFEDVNKNEALITYEAIKDADVFVMAEANRPFTIAERDALKKFVDSGKGIYFIADHYNADRNLNTWDSTEVYNGYNRSTDFQYNMGEIYGDMRNPGNAAKGWLSENFGIRFRFNAVDYKKGLSGIVSPSDSEGLTKDVEPILMAAGSTLSIIDGSKAKGLVYFGENDNPVKWGNAADDGLYFGGTDEGAFVAISKPSLGKAAFIGDSSPLEDDTPKYVNETNGNDKSTHPGYKSAGTAAKLSVNIVNWLADTEKYVGFDGINHTKGINTPTPMVDAEKDETQAEPWSEPKAPYNPWDTDTFSYGSYNAQEGDAQTVINATGVDLDKSNISLNIGQTNILSATIEPNNATNQDIIWTSSNSAVATVKNGTVIALGQGTATITATSVDGGYKTSCTVTIAGSSINVPVTSVSLNEVNTALNVGDTYTLNATIQPNNATNKNTIWTSSNTKVATINNGVITANSAGTTVITVTTADGNKTATCTITVKQSTSMDTYEPNNTMAQAYYIEPEQTYKSYIWTSSDDDYYKLKECGGKVTISLTDLPGDYNIYLYSSRGKLLASSEGYGKSFEKINYTLDENQKYYILVTSVDGAYSKTKPYSLTVKYRE